MRKPGARPSRSSRICWRPKNNDPYCGQKLWSSHRERSRKRTSPQVVPGSNNANRWPTIPGPLIDSVETERLITFGRLVTDESPVQCSPPPLLKRWLARLVRRHGRLTSGFSFGRVGKEAISRPFIGPYSLLPYAALCRVTAGTWPIRCGVAVESSVFVSLHRVARACPVQVHYSILLVGGPLEWSCPAGQQRAAVVNRDDRGRNRIRPLEAITPRAARREMRRAASD
jgi:hypothetical protein